MKMVDLKATEMTVSDLAEMAKKETVILTRNGKPLASVKDLSGNDWESVTLSNNPRFLALIEESRRSYREEGGIGLDEVRQEFGLTTGQQRRPRKKEKRSAKKL